MDFAFTDEQLAFRDVVRNLLEELCPPARLRRAWSAGEHPLQDLWRALAEVGVLGLLAPESAGGVDRSELDLVLALEETGRAALPGPVVEHAAVAVPMLAEVGDPHGWLRDAVAGRTMLTVGATGGVVAHGAVADVLIAGESESIWACTREGLTTAVLESLPSVDGARRPSRLRGRPEETVVLATGERARDLWDLASDRAALGTAAQLLGLADRMLSMAVAYAKARHQFGVAIGSFQAVKHHLADALVALEFARPVVYRAAHSIAVRDPDRRVHVSMAKAYAAEAALLVARKALQCHGAIGYTTEYDLHLFMKRAWALSAAWGDAAAHRARVGMALLGPPQGS